jgi:hypothetical protein
MHVQEACLSISKEPYQTRVDEVIAQMPVIAANNTPAGDLIGTGADAPEGAALQPGASPEAAFSQEVQSSEAGDAPDLDGSRERLFNASGPAVVTRESSSTGSLIAMESWSTGMFVLLHAVVLLWG